MDLAMRMVFIVAKATVLLGLAFLFLYLMRRRSASASRHFVCASALTTLFLIPAAAFLPLPGLAGSWPVFRVSMGTAAATSHAGIWMDWPRVVLFVWLAGSVVFALRAFFGWSIVAAKSRRFAPVDDTDWNADLASAARLLGIRGTCVMLREGNVTSPAASGVFSPAILLPKGALDWDPFRRRTVLLHELAHIRRKDCFWQQIAALACALFWFHPLVWRVAARLAREQELTCDDLALSAGVDRQAYAALLLHAAREISSDSLFACAFQGGAPAKHLRARFANILEAPASRRFYRHWTKAFLTALACFLLTVSSVKLARAEHVYRIGKNVTAPALITKVEPKYTAEARKAKIAGTVLVSVIIGKDGRTSHIHIVKGVNPGLDANAIKAIKKWHFRPATRNGKPVPVEANIEVNFKLF